MCKHYWNINWRHIWHRCVISLLAVDQRNVLELMQTRAARFNWFPRLIDGCSRTIARGNPQSINCAIVCMTSSTFRRSAKLAYKGPFLCFQMALCDSNLVQGANLFPLNNSIRHSERVYNCTSCLLLCITSLELSINACTYVWTCIYGHACTYMCMYWTAAACSDACTKPQQYVVCTARRS